MCLEHISEDLLFLDFPRLIKLRLKFYKFQIPGLSQHMAQAILTAAENPLISMHSATISLQILVRDGAVI